MAPRLCWNAIAFSTAAMWMRRERTCRARSSGSTLAHAERGNSTRASTAFTCQACGSAISNMVRWLRPAPLGATTTGSSCRSAGKLRWLVPASTVIYDTRRAAVLSPTRIDFYLVRSSSGCGCLCFSLTRASLLGQLASLLGELPHKALEFAPEMDVTFGCGLGLVYVLITMADLEHSGSMLGNAVAMGSFEQFILTGLLLSHPHNYSDALRRLEKPIAPL
jgi:hypothetical protein